MWLFLPGDIFVWMIKAEKVFESPLVMYVELWKIHWKPENDNQNLSCLSSFFKKNFKLNLFYLEFNNLDVFLKNFLSCHPFDALQKQNQPRFVHFSIVQFLVS